MKNRKLFVLGLCIMIFGALWATSATKDKGRIDFPTKSYDFGTLTDRNKPVSHEFEFENTGEGTLVILEAKAECGCTKPDYPKAPISSGKKGRIKVTFNPTGFRGAFEKTVTVRTNGDPKRVKLKIRGIIK